MLPSLRQNVIKEDYDDRLEISHEARMYISKKLSEVLDIKLKKIISYDNQIQDDDANDDESNMKQNIKSRVKLFNNSKHYIKLKKPEETVQKRRKIEDAIDNEDNCKMVAISGEDVMSRRDVKHWSTRTKAKVFAYKMDTNGKLIEIT